jgi:hypothetical protein
MITYIVYNEKCKILKVGGVCKAKEVNSNFEKLEKQLKGEL